MKTDTPQNKAHPMAGQCYFRKASGPHYQSSIIDWASGKTIAVTYYDEGATNAELISDALNTFVTTSLRPSELAAQRDELLKAVSDLVYRIEGLDDRLLAQSGSKKECELGEVVRARAILAKCEKGGTP